jgi:amino acid permease
MPEWVLWVWFVLVMLPVAAFCTVLIFALVVYARLKSQRDEANA